MLSKVGWVWRAFISPPFDLFSHFYLVREKIPYQLCVRVLSVFN
jgi:hypothetical protein